MTPRRFEATSAEVSPLGPWEPPRYRVDAHGKVVGATAGSPSNWGRWGHSDQRGTANLLTPSRISAAASLVKDGCTFSLALPIGRGAGVFGTRGETYHLLLGTTGDAVLGDVAPHGVENSDDLVVMPLQSATHVDGLGHIAHDHVMYNGFWGGLATARSGPRRLGAQQLAGGLVGRAVLADVAHHGELDPFRGLVDVEALERTLLAEQVEVGPGDILLVRTGWLGAKSSGGQTPRTRQAGVAPSLVEWLAERDVAMIAADNRTVEAVPNPEGDEILPFHRRAIRDMGLLLGELFWLDDLASHCRSTSRYDALFVAAPLPIQAASGSPLNPLVIT